MKCAAKIILVLISVLSLSTALLFLVGTVWLFRFRNYAVADELLDSHKETIKTEFYCFESRSGKKMPSPVLIEGTSLDGGIKYEYVSYENIPSNLLNAFIAIEDRHFYRHNGIDLMRTGKAIGNYLIGGERFGGSTITQQLVKNITGHDEISIERKIKEAFAAIRIEKDYEKEEIFELYLNVINLSSGCRGIGAASEYYFSKNVEDLSLSECASIAAITNNPARYDPIRHPENNLLRRNMVLERMLDLGYITVEEYQKASSEPVITNISDKFSSKINSWYIDMVIEDVITDLCKKYDLTPSSASLLLYKGGYKIYTAMDPAIQNVVEGYFSNEYNFPIDRNGKTAQSSMIIIDPYTGNILGVSGAIGNKKGNRLQNFATQSKRPPGSTIKPLSVYAPAIDNGIIEWSTVIEDSPITPETDKARAWPQNVDRRYVGNVDIKYAIEHSLNTVAVKVLEMIGAEKSFDFLYDKLNLKNLNRYSDMGAASLALGQPSKGVTLRELSGAYSIFEEGIMSIPRSYYKVCDSNGKIILDNSQEQEAVISKESAAIMTKLLETVVDTGTAAGKISLDDTISVAGKSGTSGNCHDRYFIGYTPELLAGVWFGYEYPKNLEDFGGNLSVFIWDDVMRKIYDECDLEGIANFTVPENLQRLSYEREPIVLDGETDTILEFGWFDVTNHKTD